MDKKNTNKISYLDGGDVCGFVFVIVGVVIGSGGRGGRVHLVDPSIGDPHPPALPAPAPTDIS